MSNFQGTTFRAKLRARGDGTHSRTIVEGNVLATQTTTGDLVGVRGVINHGVAEGNTVIVANTIGGLFETRTGFANNGVTGVNAGVLVRVDVSDNILTANAATTVGMRIEMGSGNTGTAFHNAVPKAFIQLIDGCENANATANLFSISGANTPMFINSGTTAGSAGAANVKATKVLSVDINGVRHYIPVFTTNA